jgi:hypothetical protein
MTEYVLKSAIHTVIGETIIADIRSQRSAYYFFVGGDGSSATDQQVAANSSYVYELGIRGKLISAKKILPSDVSFVIPRIDWVSGKVYDYFADYKTDFPSQSGATVIDNAQFYVLTDDFCVYKCLWNGLNAPSTVKPTSILSAPFVTSDGYRWKFMYSIPLSSRTRFLNNKFMPVQTALTSSFYSAGQITTTAILNQGAGYTSGTSISVAGDGVGAVLTPVVSAGQIIQVVVTNPGSGYTYANLTVNGVGTGANIVATLSVGDLDTAQADVELLAVDGSIDAYKITNQGSGYSYATVTITGDGINATGNAVISNGHIVAITANVNGSGYKQASVTITGDGSGATAEPIYSPFGGHGKNAVNELFAGRVSFYSNLLNDKNQGFAINNLFNNIGIIRNPKQFGNEKYFTQLLGSGCNVLQYAGTQPANLDILSELNTGKRFRVIQTGVGSILVQNVDNYDLKGNSILVNSTGGTIAISVVTHPTMDKYSGDLIFVDNFNINQQSGSQIIIFKTTLKF